MTINTESLVLTQNYDITASIDFASGEGNVDVDVDIDGEFNDPKAPKVGQFMQKDGSFSDTYSAEIPLPLCLPQVLKEVMWQRITDNQMVRRYGGMPWG